MSKHLFIDFFTFKADMTLKVAYIYSHNFEDQYDVTRGSIRKNSHALLYIQCSDPLRPPSESFLYVTWFRTGSLFGPPVTKRQCYVMMSS